MKKTTFLILSLLCLGAVRAQVSGYVMTQDAQTYGPLTGSISTASGDDGAQNALPIGFNFNFGGTDYLTFSISTNGFIRLNDAIGAQSWVNILNDNSPQAPIIAPYWDDHNRGAQGVISYLTSGQAPNRILEVDWADIHISTNGAANQAASGSFKVRLYETTNVIEFIYGNMVPGNNPTASVGLAVQGTFLSVTPGISATASSVTANNTIANIASVIGRKLTFTPPLPCAGAPVPGATLSSLASVCNDVSFTLTIENQQTTSGITYQWQSSSDGIAFTDIPNQTLDSYTGSQTASTYYRCLVRCGTESTPSIPVQVVQNLPTACYCIPTYDNGVTDGDLISNVVIEGTTLSNFSGVDPSGPSYTYYTGAPNHTAVLQAGSTYNISITVGTFGQQQVAVWIDSNDDGQFADSEKVGYTQGSIASGGTGTFPLNISCLIPPGVHRMRIRDVFNNSAQTLSPCANYGYGETEDYDITVAPATGCQRPAGLAVDNVNSNSALLSWEYGCGNISWDVYLTVHGGEAPSDTATHPNVQIGLPVSGLDPFTGYEFYVRANCAEGQVSQWAGPFDFTTMPEGVANDDCPTATALTPGANFEQYAVVATNVSATTSIGAPAPTCGTFGFGGDVWFSVVVPADGTVTIEVRPNPGSALQDTVMTVFSGECGNLTALGCSDDEGVGAFSMMNLSNLTPGQTLYARIWEYANDMAGTFQVSAWNASLKTAGFDRADLRYYPNPVQDVLHLSYREKLSSVSVYNLMGQQVMTRTIDTEQAAVDLSQLTPGAYLVRVTADGGSSETLKIIKE